jgi:hypothetical protein
LKRVLLVLGIFVLSLLIVVSLIVAVASDDDPPPVEVAVPLVTPASIVTEVVGEKTNHSEDDLKNPIISVRVNGEALNIKLIGNDNFSTDFIRSIMMKRSCGIFENIFAEFPAINAIFIDWHFPLIDTYGNVELSSVMTIDLARETAEKINWENFITDNLPIVADSYWHHGALN